MARCPAGHESQASDYCDTCGLVIGGQTAASAAAPSPAAPPAPAAAAGSGGATGATGVARCPVCQAERNGRFCEECGYDFDLAEAMPQTLPGPGVPLTEPIAEPGATGLGATEQGAAGADGPGLDLEAELARAEAEAARAAQAVSSAGQGSGSAPGTGAGPEPQPENAGTSPALAALEENAETHAAAAGLEAAASAALSPFAESPPANLFSEELSLTVNADHDYYAAQIERGDIIESEFPFPKYPSERRFTFADGPVRIGRASVSRGLNPEIDLTGPPLDPAVSHLHAQLLRHEEGWVVVDLGSANGTRLNDAEEPLEAETEIPVKRGDRIHLGVWTTITVE